MSVQSTTSSRGVRISSSNVGYTKFRGSVKGTGYPLHLPVFPSLSLPCVTVCHHISTGVYQQHTTAGFLEVHVSSIVMVVVIVVIIIIIQFGVEYLCVFYYSHNGWQFFPHIIYACLSFQPSVSVGNAGQLAVDLLITKIKPQKCGLIWHSANGWSRSLQFQASSFDNKC